MGEVRDREFGNFASVQTDGGHFIECKFDGTTLIYGGGLHPQFDQCSFTDVTWHFNDAALRTIQFLQVINNAPGGEKFIGRLFAPGAYLGE